MNPASDTPQTPTEHHPGGGTEAPPFSHWWEALPALISSRAALIQMESRDAARQAVRRAACIAAAAACACFTWALLLAGGIAAISHHTGCPWYWASFGAAAIHLLAAFALARSASSPGNRPFPITRAEFQKDREWIEKLKKTPKSNA